MKIQFLFAQIVLLEQTTGSIRIKSNFYGYKTNEQKLKFLLYPKGF